MADPVPPPINHAIKRSGALDLAGTLNQDPTKVDSLTPEYIELQTDRIVCARVWGGTKAMRAAGEDVLERWEGEDSQTEYEPRRKRAVLTNYFREGVESMIDDAYKEDLTMTPDESLSEEDAARLTEWWQNVDRKANKTGSQCARDSSEQSLAFGRPGILIDFPKLEAKAESAADEPDRWPLVKEIPAENIVDPQWAEIDGDVRLVSVRYYNPTTESVGFGSTRVERFTVLRRGGDGVMNAEGQAMQFARMEHFVADESGEYPEAPTEVLEFTPPARLAADRKSMFVEIPFLFKETGRGPSPKMLGLAELNTQHYRISSHYDEATIASMIPFDIFIGFNEKDLQLFQRGVNRYLATENTDAKRTDGSFSFAAAQVGEKRLDKLEAQMALMAKQPKQSRASGAEVATIRLRDDKQKMSRLQSWFLQWLAVDQDVVDWASLWLGLPASGRLGYKQEVFDALDETGLADVLDLFDRVVEYPKPLQEIAFREAQRYGRLDENIEIDGDDGLLEKLSTSGPGGMIDD